MRSPAQKAALAVALAAAQAQPAPAHQRACARRSTIRNYQVWVRHHARHGRIPLREKPAMWTLERCQRRGGRARLVAIRWRVRYLRALTFDLAHPLLTAVASWYFDAGQTASGFHARLGVANRTLRFGTRVEFHYRGRALVAVVDDRGPYVAGREWDLSQTTAAALGFAGVAAVRYRVLGR